MTSRYLVLFILLVLNMVAAGPARAENTLNVVFGRMGKDGLGIRYYAKINARKDGAVSASLTTPNGTYPMTGLGSTWIPDIEGTFDLDHSELPWSVFESTVSSGWILTWDEGLATETVARMEFDPVSGAEFAPIPVLLFPVDGADYPEGVSRVEWNFGPLDPCAGPVGDIHVAVYAAAGGMYEFFGPLACDVSSVACTEPSSGIHHIVYVDNKIDRQATSDGIGGPITGDPWVLDNEHWVIMVSRDYLTFTGSVVDVESMSFGSLKASYR